MARTYNRWLRRLEVALNRKMTPALFPVAVRYERELPKAACRPHCIRFDDGHSYIVKFQGNPVGIRSLIGEYIALRLAKNVGFAIADGGLVYVPEEFVAASPQLHGLTPGVQFGSRVLSDPPRHFSPEMIHLISNRHELVQVIALDTLLCNGDRHKENLLLVSDPAPFEKEQPWRFVIIDYSHCFENRPYSSVEFTTVFNSWARYESVLKLRSSCRHRAEWEAAVQAIEQIPDATIRDIVFSTPQQWGFPEGDANRLVEALIHRRDLIRRILHSAGLR